MEDKLKCYDSVCSEFVKACHEGNEAKVDRMLKDNIKDLDLRKRADCGMNGFMIACLKGHVGMVSLFLKNAWDLEL